MNSKLLVAIIVICISVLGVHAKSQNKHHGQKKQHHSKIYIQHYARVHAEHAKHHSKNAQNCADNPNFKCTRDEINKIIDLIYDLSTKVSPGVEANLASLHVAMTELEHHLKLNYENKNSTLDIKTLKDIVSNAKIIQQVLNDKNSSSSPVTFSSNDVKKIVDAAKELIQDMAYLRVGGMPCELLHYYVMVGVSFAPLNDRAESYFYTSNIPGEYESVSNVLDAIDNMENIMEHVPPFTQNLEINCQNNSQDYQTLLNDMRQILTNMAKITESVIFGIKNNINISSEFTTISDKIQAVADAINSVDGKLDSANGIGSAVSAFTSALAKINVEPLVSKVKSSLTGDNKSSFDLALSILVKLASGPTSLQTFTF